MGCSCSSPATVGQSTRPSSAESASSGTKTGKKEKKKGTHQTSSKSPKGAHTYGGCDYRKRSAPELDDDAYISPPTMHQEQMLLENGAHEVMQRRLIADMQALASVWSNLQHAVQAAALDEPANMATTHAVPLACQQLALHLAFRDVCKRQLDSPVYGAFADGACDYLADMECVARERGNDALADTCFEITRVIASHDEVSAVREMQIAERTWRAVVERRTARKEKKHANMMQPERRRPTVAAPHPYCQDAIDVILDSDYPDGWGDHDPRPSPPTAKHAASNTHDDDDDDSDADNHDDDSDPELLQRYAASLLRAQDRYMKRQEELERHPEAALSSLKRQLVTAAVAEETWPHVAKWGGDELQLALVTAVAAGHGKAAAVANKLASTRPPVSAHMALQRLAEAGCNLESAMR